jgi:hypothetical protein
VDVRASIERRARRTCARALLAAAALALACRAAPPEAAWPGGALLSADQAALASLLGRVASLEGTPVARAARELSQRLPDCAQLEARAPDGDVKALFAALRCADPHGELAAFHTRRGSHALLFAGPGAPDAPGTRAVATLDVDGSGARMALRWPVGGGALASWLPGDAPAGEDLLAASERVAHAHLRSAGPLDLAALVPADSQGDRLFRLRSELFSAAVLDGSVELALYAPQDGAVMPGAVVALGVRHAGAASAAMERFLDEVEASWSLRRTPLALGELRGACLRELQVLPELAPCYVAGESALVLGWNEASLRHALASDRAATRLAGADARDGLDARAAARLDVDLAGLSAADAKLAAVHGSRRPPLQWPWSRLRASAERRSGALEVEVALDPERAS